MDRVSDLRTCVKNWQRDKVISNRQALKKINDDLERLSVDLISNNVTLESRAHIRNLENEKQRLLAIEEASWRLKSRVTWLKEGDRNTKFFHRYANGRRESNSIWEIKNEMGSSVVTQEYIFKEAVKYFQEAYSSHGGKDINDIIWGIEPYPVMFDEE